MLFLEGFNLAAGQVEDLAVDGAALVGCQVFQLVVQLRVDMDAQVLVLLLRFWSPDWSYPERFLAAQRRQGADSSLRSE